MKLYSFSDLRVIQNNLLDSRLRFKFDDFSFNFTKQENYFLNRSQNKFLGLAYNCDTDNFIVNYPHINNIQKDVDASAYVVQPKFNGTNIGFVRDGNDIVWRTRGTIKPDSVYNEINISLVTKEKPMIEDNVFNLFKEKYLPIFEMGQRKNLITVAGEFNVSIPCEKLLKVIKPIFNDSSIVGVFGELISKYNPIPVDANLEYGLYLNDENDFCYYVFDVVRYDSSSQVYYLEPPKQKLTYRENGDIKFEIQTLTSWDTYSINISEKPRHIEGFVLKGEVYYKMKWDEVLNYERFISFNPFTTINTALNRVLEKEPVTEKDIESGKMRVPDFYNELYNDVLEEIKQHMSFDAFINMVCKKKGISQDKANDFLFRIYRSSLNRYLASKIVAYLLKQGIEKKNIYLKLPEYMWFEDYPLVFNQRRGKYIPKFDWYGRLISNVVYGGKYENA